MKTIEERTAETILQQPKAVEIDGKCYEIAPPTTATLILVSGMISRLPQFGELDKLQGEDMLFHALANAKDCEKVAEIAAVMIVGAKEYKKSHLQSLLQQSQKQSLLRRIFRKESLFDKVKNAVLNSSPKKLDEIIGVCLQGMQVQDFFLVTTFLNKVNLTKQTKSKTTQSGQ